MPVTHALVAGSPQTPRVTNTDWNAGHTVSVSMAEINASGAPSSSTFLRGDGSWATPSGSGTVTTTGTPAAGNLAAFSGATSITNSDLSGDVTTTGTLSTTIANSAVTLAKMANVATASVFYRKTAGTGAPEVQTLATLKTDLGLTGTNSGDQTITLTSDVTGSGTGSFATTIANSAVTLAKMANMATASLIYRKTAGTGVPEVNTLATLKTDLGLTGTNSGDQTITLTGDVTGSGTGSFAATIANSAVTLAKIANAAANSKLLGSGAAGSGSPYAELTLGTNLSMSGTTLNATGGSSLDLVSYTYFGGV